MGVTMEKIVGLLRKISIKKRMKFAFVLLCLFPIGILFVFNSLYDYYNSNQIEGKYTSNYAYQAELKVSNIFAQYMEKLEYLSKNNDILADLYLYMNDKNYRSQVVEKRIEDIMKSVMSNQEGIEFAGIITEKGDLFSYGKMILNTEKIMNRASDFNQTIYEKNGSHYELSVIKKVQIRYDRPDFAYFVMYIKPEYLDKECGEIAANSNHEILIMSGEGLVISSSVTAYKGTILNINKKEVKQYYDYLISDLGFHVVSIFKEPENNRVVDMYLLIVTIMISTASFGLVYFTMESLIVPLAQLLLRMKNIGHSNEIQEIENAPYTEDLNIGQDRQLFSDEYAALDIEFSHMIERLNQLIKEVYRSEISERELQAHIKELELNALQQQINPHFLYNVMENIFWMAQMKGYERISEMISLLGEFFKTSVSEKGDYITIATEVENVKSYVRIQQIMHQESFQIIWNMRDDIVNCKTVKLVLQPIIENSIIHGFSEMEQGGILWIEGSREDHRIVFTVQDNGIGMTKEKQLELNEYINNKDYDVKRSIGLKNVNQRIKIYFGDEYGIDITSTLNKGTQVRIVIPVKD